MDKGFDLARAFARDAVLLRLARESAMLMHPTDVRAAGNEVERAVRDYFRRILPSRYYITSGHLIDCHQRVSPQIDIVIADALNLPSLYTAQDGTEYVPTTSVFAIGEVKSTYYKSGSYFPKFSKSLSQIARMYRPLTENTAHDGKLTEHTTLLDMVRGSKNKVLNHLFSFLFVVDVGDFSFKDIVSHLNSTEPTLLPNVTVLLNKGTVIRTRISDAGEAKFHKYPTEAPSPEYDCMFAESMNSKEGSKEGSNLALLYGMLVDHLSNSHLEPGDAYAYTAELVNLRRSTLEWARGTPPGTAHDSPHRS